MLHGWKADPLRGHNFCNLSHLCDRNLRKFIFETMKTFFSFFKIVFSSNKSPFWPIHFITEVVKIASFFVSFLFYGQPEVLDNGFYAPLCFCFALLRIRKFFLNICTYGSFKNQVYKRRGGRTQVVQKCFFVNVYKVENVNIRQQVGKKIPKLVNVVYGHPLSLSTCTQCILQFDNN